MPREGFARTFLRAIEDQGAIKRLVALPDGERRVTDLRHLVELLHAASLERHLGTSGLLAWLRAQRAGDEDDPEATHVRLESDAEAVQVVTLHVSKGLQYPIVVLPYLWDAATITQPERSRLRYHDPSGHTVVDVRTGRKAGDPGLVEATREARQEALRLAYVALTRAKHATVLMTGPFKGLEGSPIAALLHGDRVRKIDRVEAIRLHADLEDLAERSEGAIAVRDLPVADRTRYRGLRGPLAPELVVRTFARERFDKRWGRVSYTALTRGPELPAEELGEDWDGADTEAAIEVVGPDVPLAAFPAGAEAGKLVHKVLEHLEFRSLRERVVPQRDLEALVAHHGRIAGLGDPDAWSLLARELPTALATPLGPLGTSLATVAETDRLDELRFDLPVAGGDAFQSEASAADGRRLLAPMLAREELGGYRAALERLDIHRLAGFLTGSIDLVLRVDGRYYVVDYKTNRLGTRKDGVLRSTVAHYGPAGMRGEMEKHHYHLQAHLYLVALHRWLATRVPDYRYERHVGGALYLFLRGMVGPGDAGGPRRVLRRALRRDDRGHVPRARGDAMTLRVRAKSFVEAGVLGPLEVHVVERLAAAVGLDDDEVQLGLAFAVRAPRVGHVGVDLGTVAVDSEPRSRGPPIARRGTRAPRRARWSARIDRSCTWVGSSSRGATTPTRPASRPRSSRARRRRWSRTPRRSTSSSTSCSARRVVGSPTCNASPRSSRCCARSR